MAPIVALAHTSSYSNYEQSLHSAALELKYERSTHLVDIIAKDEATRKMRFDIHVLEDDNEELRDLLNQEEDRSESLEKLVNNHLLRAEDAEAQVQELSEEVHLKGQELSNLRAEAIALRNSTTDSTKLLTEKLQLTRELSTMKPELDHLRSQVSANQEILAEKLSLQRQLSEVQVELEHAKSEAKRAFAKRRNTQHDLAQEDTIDDLRKALTREKRLREKAEEATEAALADLESEKKSVQRKVAKEAKKAENDAQTDVETEELRRSLAVEKKEKERAEKVFQKSQSEWDGTKSILEDKLNQFRSKLKSTKEKLKETEIQLAQAQVAAAAALKQDKSAALAAVAKPQKKRTATQMDPDSQKLGTPGNEKPAKRSRKAVAAAAAAAVGDKSTFSITPFLNRTMSMGGAPPSPSSDAEDAQQDSEAEELEHSPMARAPSAEPISKQSKKQPLTEVPASKTNIKKRPQPRKEKIILEKVVEEIEPSSQDSRKITSKVAPISTTTTKVILKSTSEDADSAPVQKAKPKIRKSLATFAAFSLDPEPEKKQRKRKLGGLGKTLFDDDNDDDIATKPLPGRAALFGNTRIGPLGGLKVGASFLGGGRLMGMKKKGGLLQTGDGFCFSPLKKDRKAAGMSFLK